MQIHEAILTYFTCKIKQVYQSSLQYLNQLFTVYSTTIFFLWQQKQRIQQKAEMTHKQRVEKFNQHLDSLTEHFDIPKVSWTK